jgi:HlyD family secretion protein
MNAATLVGTEPEPPPTDGARPGSPPPAAAPPAPSRRRVRWTRRRIGLTAGGVGLLALLFLAFRPQPLPVETREVVRGPLETTINADGVTRVREVYRVTSPVSGRLERVHVRAGDRVAEGQVVARLHALPMDEAAAQQAAARVAGAEARLAEARGRRSTAAAAAELARRHAGRVAEVGAAGGLPREAVERAEVEARAAEEELAAAAGHVFAAEREAVAARAALPGATGGRLVEVRAPTAGRVLRVSDASERVLAAGTPLVELGDAAGLEVVADVLSADAVRVRAGAPVRAHAWGGEGILEGRVRLVEPSGFTKISALGVEEQRVNVVADLTEIPAELGDGFRVELRIVTWAATDAVKVPTGALFRSGEGWALYTVEGGRAVRREVTIGARGAEEAQVLGGLSPGDRVVMFPGDQLRDGVRVREP